MHSQLALTEHASLNLAPLILLDPVYLELICAPADLQLCRRAAPGQPEAADLREEGARTVQDLLDHGDGHGLCRLW